MSITSDLFGKLLAAREERDRARTERDAAEAQCEIAEGWAELLEEERNFARERLAVANKRIDALEQQVHVYASGEMRDALRSCYARPDGFERP
jgi:hypothetical protein